MKIVALALAGFGPFKSEQRIDFERFDDDGIFLISGRTGAGKSSILDAICYALYGSIPRFDGSQQKLRSDHCAPDDPTFVSLDFTVGDSLYRVRRSPEFERAKQRGTGTTISAPTAQLSRRVDSRDHSAWSEPGTGTGTGSGNSSDGSGETWVGLAARPVDVGKLLIDIVGLTRDQFLQVILLAQNRFQQFLRSSNDDRQAVLRSLFGTERFLTYEKLLIEKHKTRAATLAEGQAELARHTTDLTRLLSPIDLDASEHDTSEHDIPEHEAREHPVGIAQSSNLPGGAEWFESALLDLNAESVRAATEVARTADVLAAADRALARLIEFQALLHRRDAATRTLNALQSETGQIAAEKIRIEAADGARSVWPFITAATAANDALNLAEIEVNEARNDFATHGDRAIALAALDQIIDESHRQLGALERSLEEERALPLLSAAVQAGEDLCTRNQNAETALAGPLADLPRQINELTTAVTIARLSAGLEPSAVEAVERLSAASEAASQAVQLHGELEHASTAELAASREHLAAASRHQSLMEQRLFGHAAELAAELVEGVACAVCGSSSHPAPAFATSEPVSQSQIDDARITVSEAQNAMDLATTARVLIATRLAEARARTDSQTPQQLAEQLDAAEGTLEKCRADRALAAEQAVDLGELSAALERGQREITTLRETRQVLLVELAEKRATHATSVLSIDSQRGQSESVSALFDAISSSLNSARTLQSAISLTSRCETVRAAAQVQLRENLAECGFADQESATHSHLSAAQLDASTTRVRLWEQGVATAKSILADPLLASLPRSAANSDSESDAESETAAVAAAAEHRYAAQSERDSALTLRATVTGRLAESTRIVIAARSVIASSAVLQGEFEELHGLANAVQGKEPNTRRMRLETYVLAAQLEQIVAAANARLRVMTGGRYTLEHDDSVQYRNTQSGLGLSILDEHTGRTRATNSLSGGETFLASLALALGLAEVVTNQAGGIRLDTLFIDEGFGSLDAETLDIAMSTLDGLRAGGRTIGLISHVGSMKEQITSTVSVHVSPRGDSTIEAMPR